MNQVFWSLFLRVGILYGQKFLPHCSYFRMENIRKGIVRWKRKLLLHKFNTFRHNTSKTSPPFDRVTVTAISTVQIPKGKSHGGFVPPLPDVLYENVLNPSSSFYKSTGHQGLKREMVPRQAVLFWFINTWQVVAASLAIPKKESIWDRLSSEISFFTLLLCSPASHRKKKSTLAGTLQNF